MRNYLSRSRSSRPTTLNPFAEKRTGETRPLNGEHDRDDGDSATEEPTFLPPPPNLKVKKVDHYWSNWSNAWKFKNTGSSVAAEAVRPLANDPWQNFCFVVVRKFPHPRNAEKEDIAYRIVIKSPYLLKICKDVIKQVSGVSWTADPLELDPNLLLAFFPQFAEYEKQLRAAKRTQQDANVLMTFGVFLDYLRKEYRATLAKIANLTAHGEITFDLLYAILVPRTILITECPVTGETSALQILSAKQIGGGSTLRPLAYWVLCENVDSLEDAIHGRSVNNAAPTTPMNHAAPVPNNPIIARPRFGGKTFGRVQSKIYIEHFSGTKKINSLAAYPLQYHHDPDALKQMLIERGRKWASLKGIHHMHYEGTAAIRLGKESYETFVKYNVNSRVMIDRRSFLRLHPNYARPKASDTGQPETMAPPSHNGDPLSFHEYREYVSQTQSQRFSGAEPNVFTLQLRTATAAEDLQLTDDDYLLATPILYGYSLTDKIWLELNVQHVQPIVWNEEAFDNLVLADDRKHLLRSLVDAHSVDLGFDDFVQGKGQGLIINLFGPPGVGKTLSAEATSERVHRPLYVVGGGDLGTKAADVDAELTRVFDIATSWKAIVLIDEADVFLERRSLHDLERNAMVAVFLRHIEYYRGILFLTTNRITAFDPAFLSRIHVALHFGDLTPAARAQVWRAFLRKAGISEQPEVEDDLIRRLAQREVNGRQIKNACRTAQSLAYSRSEKLRVEHLEETLDAMEDFNIEFAALTKVSG